MTARKTKPKKKPRAKKKPTPLLVRHFPIDLYGRCVSFVYGTIPQANAYFARLHRRAGAPPPSYELRENCRGHWKMMQDDEGYESDHIFLRRDSGPITELSSLAHECLHATAHALRTNGMPLTEESEEAYTYYLQHLICACLTAIRGR